MKESTRAFFIRKIYQAPPAVLKHPKVEEWLKVYHDVENTLRRLRRIYARGSRLENKLRQINLRKLLSQLSGSKRKLERKIGNTLLLEKSHIKRRIKGMASSLRVKQEGSERFKKFL